ncbi:MAG TPA: pectate lyase [Allosphingosinicella sp.]|nr:pectate lyase [Allosphingosinicella sp.]
MRMIVLALAAVSTVSWAAVVGTNVPVQPLTEARVAALPAPGRAAWARYLARSRAAMQADKAAFAAEVATARTPPPPAPEGNGARTMPLDRPAAWYGSTEARHVADVIVSFQTPSGGWSKNQPRDGAVRVPGQPYAGANAAPVPQKPGDFDKPRDEHWHYVGTIDNDATITEIRFLARVAGQLPAAEAAAYKASALKGIDYLFAAQFPNGGWPQVWPLEGGYHDAITYNDDAMTNVLQLMLDVADGDKQFAFVPGAVRRRAAQSLSAGLNCILATQVRTGGRRTAWGQQHDPLTLQPVSARNFEPPALSTAESARLLIFLMHLPHPSEAVKAAVRDGIAWLKATAISSHAWIRTDQGRELVERPGAPLVWPRYISLQTGKPIFGDRDKSIHDDVMEITPERRNGYAWFSTGPQAAIDHYARWEYRP